MTDYYAEGYKFNKWLQKKGVAIKSGVAASRSSLIYEAGLMFKLSEKAMHKRIDAMITYEDFQEDDYGTIEKKTKGEKTK